MVADVQQFVDDLLPSEVQRAGVFLEVQGNRDQRVAWLQAQNFLGSPAVPGTLEVISRRERMDPNSCSLAHEQRRRLRAASIS